MHLVKTLPNGHKVYSVVERVDGVSTGFYVELDSQGKEVRKWQPSFDELASHSPASKRLGH